MFPAHAGMDRKCWTPWTLPRRVPRTCGDGPTPFIDVNGNPLCSPHMRGWTAPDRAGEYSGPVFPAHAGMDRIPSGGRCSTICVPRTCGDGPTIVDAGSEIEQCSPHMRGWTEWEEARVKARAVFPAHAGMDRRRGLQPLPRPGVPRTCGDGPPAPGPTPAPEGVPRTCGDGPLLTPVKYRPRKCSPHMRGWTDSGRTIQGGGCVFPAHAGMDREKRHWSLHSGGVPRTCGDGPFMVWPSANAMSCSPHMRGWTAIIILLNYPHKVFPAHAGMDRKCCRHLTRPGGVPRTCGDGP